ncbi:Uncharacterised protein [Neisseria meningitidis]|nr:Uncharacterised protein [Neisseria meningitidis]
MQVRPGRTPGRTDKTDDLAAAHIAFRLRKRAQVRVQRFHTVGVAYHHRVAVSALPAFKGNHAVGGSPDRRSLRCGIIDARVQPPCVQDGVHTVAERRRNARIDQRLDVEAAFFLQHLAVFIIIIAAPSAFLVRTVIERLMPCAALNDFSRQNIARRHLLPVEIQAVVHQAHGIAFLQTVKAEAAGENPA